MKRILLISYNFYPELTGIGKYNGEMVEWFVRKRYDCTVLTAYPYYPNWKVQDAYRSKRFWYSTEAPQIPGAAGTLRVHRCPLYVPKNPSGFGRIVLEVTFLVSAFIRLLPLMLGKKYDIVIAVTPPFYVGFLAMLYKRLRGARVVYHIQDLQIEAARELKIIRSHALFKLLFFLERMILRYADVVSTISQGMLKKLLEKGCSSTILFPNWTNTSHFFPIEDRGFLKCEFGFDETDKVILYSGAIGEKQGVEAILMAARAHRQNPTLKFVICGNGPYRRKLEETALRLALDNVVFLPLQPPSRFNHFLNMADIHLVIQKAGAGDLVMPSKLGAILAVGGLALITANDGTSLYDVVHQHEIAYVVDADDQKAFNDAIAKLLSGDYRYLRHNARHYALQFLSTDKVMGTFEKALTGTPIKRKTADRVTISELANDVTL